MRVLLVEPAGSTATGRALHDAGFVPELVQTGRSALDRLTHREFDLLVSAVNVPDISGFDLLSYVQAQKESRREERLSTSQPCVILFDHTSSVLDQAESAIDRGADAFLYPPYDPHQLRLTIRSLMKRSRVERERRAVVTEMRKYGQRLHSIVENLNALILETEGGFSSEDHRLVYASAYVKCLGYSSDELSRKPGAWLTLIHPEDRSRAHEAMNEAIVRRTSVAVSLRLFTSDGRIVPFSGHLFPIVDDESHPFGLRLLLLDQTERIAAEQDVLKAREEVEASSRAKDHFLSVISHELRTPLTPVMTSIEMLQTENLSEEGQYLLEMIRRNVELEAHLINDLLDLTRLQKGRFDLNLRAVDLHELIANVLTICNTELRQKEIELNVALEASTAVVMGDPVRLQQIVWNLLHNAVKFSPANRTIDVRTSMKSSEGDRGTLVLEIVDHGIGIEPELLPYIFDAFEQGDLFITRQFGGLGLGLTIARKLIELHGGVISAESAGRDHGATFRIELPMISAIPLTDDPDQIPLDLAVKQKPTILLVDDHEDTGHVLELLLQRRGFSVVRAISRQTALAAARITDFDLLLSDIGLPDGTGYTLLSEIREFKRDVPALALSGFGTNDDIARSLAAGFASHITKPFNFPDLHQKIEELIRA